MKRILKYRIGRIALHVLMIFWTDKNPGFYLSGIAREIFED